MNAAHMHLQRGVRRVIRIAPARRNLIALLAACAATFFAVLFLFRDDGPGYANADGVVTAARDLGGAAGLGTRVSTPVQPGPGTGAARLRPITVARVNSPPLVGTSARAEETSEATYGVAGASSTIAYSGDADARAAAIGDLDDARATPESLGVLEQTVRFDDVSRNRILAVDLLRRLGQHGDAGGRIAALLQIALGDADANVATNARDALRQLGH